MKYKVKIREESKFEGTYNGYLLNNGSSEPLGEINSKVKAESPKTMFRLVAMVYV
jgi:hypothetical protein